MDYVDQMDIRIITLYDRSIRAGLVRWGQNKMNLSVVAIALFTPDPAGSQWQVSTVTDGRSIHIPPSRILSPPSLCRVSVAVEL